MPRFINPNPQFSDKNGSPLAFGSITFYESGTTTFKTTYSDPGLTVPNANPVPLDAAGRAQTDIFYEGDASVILKDSNNGVQWQDDPVSSSNSSSFPDWNAGTSYQVDDIVKYEGNFYRAIAPSTNELPTNQEFWSKILQTEEWNPNDTYNTDALVVRNGIHYISLIDSNTSDPETASNEWRASSSATVIYEDTGSSLNYEVAAKSGFANQSLEDGLTIKFIASNSSSNSATLDFASSGSKDILTSNLDPIGQSSISAGDNVELFYSATSDAWIYQDQIGSAVNLSIVNNPVVNILKKGKLVDTLAPSNLSSDLTWTRSTTATFKNKYGILTTAAIDTPREDIDGWLIEGARTNLIVYSEDFTNAAWNKTGSVTIAPSAQLAPDQSTQVQEFFGNNSTGSANGVVQNTAGGISDNESITASIFVKNTDADIITLRSNVNGGTAVVNDVEFDIANGTVISGNGSIEEYIDGWYRISSSVTNNATGNSNAQIRLYISDNGNGNGSFYLFGAQIEILEFNTSYIPTTNSTQLRGADIVSFNFDDNIPGYNSDKTLFLNAFLLGARSQNQYIIDSVGATDFRYQITSNINGIFRHGNNSVALSGLNTDKFISLCGTYRSNGTLNNFINGSSVGTNQDGVPLTSGIGTSVFVGRSTTGANAAFIKILDLRIYDSVLTEEEVLLLSRS